MIVRSDRGRPPGTTVGLIGTVLVHGAVVASAEQHQVLEGRFAALCPVLHVVCVDEPAVFATGKAAALVA